jgi:flagellar biosynthesis protein FlhF
MKIKTFYAKTMPEALHDIKAHLGPEAVLLSTREIPRRSGSWGKSSGFEVVAAADNANELDVFSPGREEALPNRNIESSELKSAGSRVTETETYSPASLMKNRAVATTKRIKSSTKASESDMEADESRALDKEFPFKGRASVGLYQNLLDCGVENWLARKLLLMACESLAAGHRRSRTALIRSIAQAALTLVPPSSTRNGMPGKRVVAFVGPTGVGKTTSIVKLAARLALQKKKKVILMTMDGYRIGAIEQLRTYAGLMGVPFRYVDRVSDLSRAIADNNQRDYILLDTAGRGPRDLAGMSQLSAFLRQSTHIERHLVLSATTKPSDLRKIMDQFEVCGPDHLLFTKLDETSTPGPILNELVRTQKAFSYYSDGQRVPDDLHAVPRDRIIDIVLNRNDIAIKE